MNPLENALNQLSSVSKHLNLPRETLEILKKPQKVLEVNFPVKMDDGSVKIFKGFRSQHQNARGPYKGGIRFHSKVTREEVIALSMWMSWKCAVIGLPYGGGKGGVVVDPKKLSPKELKRLSQAYVRAIAPIIGPKTDIPAPDVGTDSKIMGWMVREYLRALRLPTEILVSASDSLAKKRALSKKTHRRSQGEASQNLVDSPRFRFSEAEVLATFTGKPIGMGGSLGRESATGRGGLYVLQAFFQAVGDAFLAHECKKIKKFPRILEGLRHRFARKDHLLPEGISIAVQGFGNVGYWFAKLAQEAGFKIIAISDSRGGVKMESGEWKMEEVIKHKKKTGSVTKFPGSIPITNHQLLVTPCDILVPAALENVINAKIAPKVKAKVILELANGPTTPEADRILKRKKIIVLPDVLANAGGVTVSYFEWLQNLKSERWDEAKVNRRLKRRMTTAFKEVWQVMQEKNLDGRTAAYVLAVDKVAKTIKT